MMRTLYEELGSFFSLEARWVLERKRLPYRAVAVAGEAAEALRSRCGDERPPILHDADAWIAGPRAIAFFLERRHPERPLFPEDPQKRNQAVTFAEFAETAIGPLVATLRSAERPDGPDAGALAELRDCLGKVRDALSRGALGSRDRHLGDVAIAAHLEGCRGVPTLAFEREYPDLVAFLTRVRAWVLAGGPR